MRELIESAAIERLVKELNLVAKGSIQLEDQVFLGSLLLHTAPERILEVGTASGISTRFMAEVINRYLKIGKITSIDPAEKWWVDQSSPVGFVVSESSVSSLVDLRKKIVPQLVEDSVVDFDFVFIDAYHLHPWPTLDTIFASFITKPGSWIAHHDIRLPYEHKNCEMFGAVYLFDGFKGEKIVPVKGKRNIGAIRFEDGLVDKLMPLLSLKWEVKVPEYAITCMKNVMKQKLPRLSDEFSSVLDSKN
jgi:predicted O-methyltransferase YrrM